MVDAQDSSDEDDSDNSDEVDGEALKVRDCSSWHVLLPKDASPVG